MAKQFWKILEVLLDKNVFQTAGFELNGHPIDHPWQLKTNNIIYLLIIELIIIHFNWSPGRNLTVGFQLPITPGNWKRR